MFMEKCLLSWFLLAIFKYKLIWGVEDYNVLNQDGSYEFGYENRDSYHHSQANRNNIVRGEFGSRNPKTGAIDSTVYTAGPRGFRPRGKNIVRKYDLNQSGPRPIGSRDDPYYDPNEDPSYNFGFKTRTYDRQEAANRVGDVTGKYSYLDDVGERHNVEYIAGKRTGFHVKTPFPDSNPRAYGPLYFNGRGKPIPRGRTSIQRGLDGSYRFISAGPDQRRTETSDATGHVRGSYTYLDDKGVQHSVHYIAGPGIGYRVLKNVKGPHLPTIFPFGRPEIIPKDYYDYPSPGFDDVFDTAASGHIKPSKGGAKPSTPNKDDKFDSDNGSDLSGNNRDKFDDNLGGSGGSNNYDDEESGGSDIFGGRPNNSGSGGGNSGGGSSRPTGSGSGQGNKPNYGGGGSSKPDYGDEDDDFDLFGNGGSSTNRPSKPRPNQNNSGNKGSGGSTDDGSYNPSGEDGSYRPGTSGSSGNSGKPSGGLGPSSTDESGSGGIGGSGSGGTGGSGSGGSGSGGSGSGGTGGSGPSGTSGPSGGGSGGSNVPTTDDSDDFGLFGGSGSNKPSGNAGGSSTGGVHIGIRPIDSDNPRDDDSYDNRGTLVTNVGDKLFAVPPGVSVRAHVQAIDLLPLLPRSPSPSEQLRAEMKDQLKAESSNLNEQSEDGNSTTTTKTNLRSKKSNLKDS